MVFVLKLDTGARVNVLSRSVYEKLGSCNDLKPADKNLKAYSGSPIPLLAKATQVDTSSHALGAVIMQNGRPVEYATKALTETQKLINASNYFPLQWDVLMENMF